MRPWFVLALALVACGRKADDPRRACADAANKGVDAMIRRANDRLTTAKLPDDVRATMMERTSKLGELAPRLKAVFANRCVDDKWPREVIDCYGKASSVDEMRSCRGKLPGDSATRLMKDEMDLMAGAMAPPSMAAVGPKGPVDPAQIEAANKLAEELRAVGARVNETLGKIQAAKSDAERSAAQAELEVLKKQSDEIRERLAAAQAQATMPIAPPPPSPEQQAAIDAVQKEIEAAVRAIESAKNDAERAAARAKLQELQEKLRQAKRGRP
jgi:hypothetical protein